MASTDSIITPFFRLSFPEVFEPRPVMKGSEKKEFSIQMIFVDQSDFYPRDDKGQFTKPPAMRQEDFDRFLADYLKDPTLGIQFRRLAVQAFKAGWGDDKSKWPAPFDTVDLLTYLSEDGKRYPIRNGNFVNWDGFKGQVFAKAKANIQRRPGVVDAHNKVIVDPSKVFGGLIARAKIHAYSWENASGKGVSFGLEHLQIIRDDGTRFGASSGPVEEAFGAWEDGSMDPSSYPENPSLGGAGVVAGDEF